MGKRDVLASKHNDHEMHWWLRSQPTWDSIHCRLQRILLICSMYFFQSTVFIPILTHALLTTHQHHFQFKISGTINRPWKLSHPVASEYVSSLVLNTENHQWTLCSSFYILTFWAISFFHQLFKHKNFNHCQNQESQAQNNFFIKLMANCHLKVLENTCGRLLPSCVSAPPGLR